MNRALRVTTALLIGQASAQTYLEPPTADDAVTPLDQESTDLSSGAPFDASGPEVQLDPRAAQAVEAQFEAQQDPLGEDEAAVPPAADEQGIGGAGPEPVSPEEVDAEAVSAENGDEPPGVDVDAEEGSVAGADDGEVSEAAVRQLNVRLRQLEARMAELEAQGTAAQAEVAALQEEAATLQESASAPGEAADQQRESRELRVRTLENAMALVVQAYEIVETGEDDVSETLGSASAALAEGQGLAEHAGSPLEAQRFEAAVRAISEVPSALTERDFQRAKELLAMTLAECNQARLLARASTTLPVTAR